MSDQAPKKWNLGKPERATPAPEPDPPSAPKAAPRPAPSGAKLANPRNAGPAEESAPPPGRQLPVPEPERALPKQPSTKLGHPLVVVGVGVGTIAAFFWFVFARPRGLPDAPPIPSVTLTNAEAKTGVDAPLAAAAPVSPGQAAQDLVIAAEILGSVTPFLAERALLAGEEPPALPDPSSYEFVPPSLTSIPMPRKGEPGHLETRLMIEARMMEAIENGQGAIVRARENSVWAPAVMALSSRLRAEARLLDAKESGNEEDRVQAEGALATMRQTQTSEQVDGALFQILPEAYARTLSAARKSQGL